MSKQRIISLGGGSSGGSDTIEIIPTTHHVIIPTAYLTQGSVIFIKDANALSSLANPIIIVGENGELFDTLSQLEISVENAVWEIKPSADQTYYYIIQ